ncbi:potassium-transporting ATPase subunit KdpC [Methylomonas paludis]|uniref:Potassium-transporting ATPase KdpC subunit n=1 Tax=Methylomonas paludis TaxID=1173101 RepID=A0A975R9R1_9GAMM|nr:potassium-transporting ATPase subunit KdpC [Methylomonas paludis]QWF70504.1 potassium-transporting ATPase subunit KdpC [Methylomonas paludis]
MNNNLRPLCSTFIFFLILTGLGYPLLITGIAQLFFPVQANGSLIEKDGKLIGSRLIGQNFSSDYYFWGRLSATGSFPYNAGLSGGSNLGPLNPALVQEVSARVLALQSADPDKHKPIPADLATSSASGLDPEISLASAHYQINRVAKARHLSVLQVRELIQAHIRPVLFGFLGESRVNVLELNLALDELSNSNNNN